MSWIVKVGKQGKKIVKKLIMPAEKHYVGYTRRIERVQTTRRICARPAAPALTTAPWPGAGKTASSPRRRTRRIT